LFNSIPAGAVADHPIGEALAAHIGRFVESVALAEVEGGLTVSVPAVGEGEAEALSLPQFKFDAALRAKAAGSLASGRGVAVDFGLAERLALKAALRSKLNAALGQDVETADLGLLPAAARRWVLENRKVLAAFD